MLHFKLGTATPRLVFENEGADIRRAAAAAIPAGRRHSGCVRIKPSRQKRFRGSWSNSFSG